MNSGNHGLLLAAVVSMKLVKPLEEIDCDSEELLILTVAVFPTLVEDPQPCDRPISLHVSTASESQQRLR